MTESSEKSQKSHLVSSAHAGSVERRATGGWWYQKGRGGFVVVRDEGSLISFDSGVIKDKFCLHCGNGVTGIHSSGPLKNQILVNINLIMELNPFKVKPVHVITEDPDPAPPRLADKPAVQYGSCTCGQLASVGSYETKDDVRIHGKENTFEYLWKARMSGPAMCKTCGVYMFSNIYGPPISFFDKLPPERVPIVMDTYVTNMNLQPVSVRVFDDVDISTLKIEYDDCGTEGYKLDT
ncbi:hypothetical protein NQ176_g3722 [Zarea fungicola]|uniref:Uncharacterized protein n=1 Tax=Zarea fungicola TaxID=93591 RepID=A0ACC1NGZ0_9HYPO|nr:hypothetical protein NQ176_g3722 [Lecanicillium fungicola]